MTLYCREYPLLFPSTRKDIANGTKTKVPVIKRTNQIWRLLPEASSLQTDVSSPLAADTGESDPSPPRHEQQMKPWPIHTILGSSRLQTINTRAPYSRLQNEAQHKWPGRSRIPVNCPPFPLFDLPIFPPCSSHCFHASDTQLNAFTVAHKQTQTFASWRHRRVRGSPSEPGDLELRGSSPSRTDQRFGCPAIMTPLPLFSQQVRGRGGPLYKSRGAQSAATGHRQWTQRGDGRVSQEHVAPTVASRWKAAYTAAGSDRVLKHRLKRLKIYVAAAVWRLPRGSLCQRESL